jgi:hypothetical protein
MAFDDSPGLSKAKSWERGHPASSLQWFESFNPVPLNDFARAADC